MLQAQAIAQAEWFTVGQAAREMDSLLGYVYVLLRSGKLDAQKIDGKWYINPQSVAARIASVNARKRKK